MNNFLRDKRVWYGAGALAVILIVGGVAWFLMKPVSPSSPQISGGGASSMQGQVAATTSSTTPPALSPTKTVSSKPLTYEQALIQYANRRIQIQQGCQLSPANTVFKNGTYVMFDNRTSESQMIALDGVHYSISRYGFRIIRLFDARLPHTIQIDCGTGKNNGKIVLQG